MQGLRLLPGWVVLLRNAAFRVLDTLWQCPA